VADQTQMRLSSVGVSYSCFRCVGGAPWLYGGRAGLVIGALVGSIPFRHPHGTSGKSRGAGFGVSSGCAAGTVYMIRLSTGSALRGPRVRVPTYRGIHADARHGTGERGRHRVLMCGTRKVDSRSAGFTQAIMLSAQRRARIDRAHELHRWWPSARCWARTQRFSTRRHRMGHTCNRGDSRRADPQALQTMSREAQRARTAARTILGLAETEIAEMFGKAALT